MYEGNTNTNDPDKTLSLTSSSGGSGRTGVDTSSHTRSKNYDPDGFGPGNSLVTHQISYDKEQKRLRFIVSSTAPPIQIYVQSGMQRYSATMEQNQPFLSEKKLVFSAHFQIQHMSIFW